MRILVVAPRRGEAGRIERAALGLALRGHEVSWWGARPAEAADPAALTRRRELWSLGCDIVLGGGAAWRTAAAGWQAQVRCMVLEILPEQVSRWTPLDRWAWHASHSFGLIEPDQAPRFRDDAIGLDPERLALWSDAAPGGPEIVHPDTEILERACQRALARQRGRASRPAVFVDRDGTLVREVGYLADPRDLELLPGVAEALRRFSAAGYAIVVVSNQSAVGRGLVPLSSVYQAMARLRVLLRADRVELDAIYFCPHRPEENCPCRKPRIGLLERAAQDLQLALSRSVTIGDKLLDVAAGHDAGARGVLVRSGYGADEERRLGAPASGLGERPTDPVEIGRLERPDAVCDDLPQAAAWILRGGTE